MCPGGADLSHGFGGVERQSSRCGVLRLYQLATGKTVGLWDDAASKKQEELTASQRADEGRKALAEAVAALTRSQRELIAELIVGLQQRGIAPTRHECGFQAYSSIVGKPGRFKSFFPKRYVKGWIISDDWVLTTDGEIRVPISKGVGGYGGGDGRKPLEPGHVIPLPILDDQREPEYGFGGHAVPKGTRFHGTIRAAAMKYL